MPSPLPTSMPIIKRCKASILLTTSIKPFYTKKPYEYYTTYSPKTKHPIFGRLARRSK